MQSVYASKLTKEKIWPDFSAHFRSPSTAASYESDIREVQLAKGAIAAGIQLLCRHLEVEIGDIQEVLIAGAFGNYMSPASACAIGLLPKELYDRIIPIGNAAGEGAKLAVLRREQYDLARQLMDQVEFIELAMDPDFQDIFVDQLAFYEDD